MPKRAGFSGAMCLTTSAHICKLPAEEILSLLCPSLAVVYITPQCCNLMARPPPPSDGTSGDVPQQASAADCRSLAEQHAQRSRRIWLHWWVIIASCSCARLCELPIGKVKVEVTTPPRAKFGRRETYGLLLSSGPTTDARTEL